MRIEPEVGVEPTTYRLQGDCSDQLSYSGGRTDGTRPSLVGSGEAGRMEPVPLTDRDKAILDFERSWWSEPGPKETAIRERFELSPTRYYEILNQLLEDPEAMDYDPLVVRRLRRLRDRRRRQRYEGRTIGENR
jgi:uncharacterized protein DUF3263